MTIVYDKLLSLHIPDGKQAYTFKDSILYGLGLGLGIDPMNEAELKFVYEGDQKALPTQAVVMAHPGFWLRDLDTGIDWVKMVAGEFDLTLHTTLPTSGTVVSKNRVVEIYDKGEGRGAVVQYEKKIVDDASGEVLATILQSTFCRGDGGFGGPERKQAKPHQVPTDRAPDLTCDLPTLAQGALTYRLSGDYNPLHADPAVAKAAGFDRPILHGLGTFGVAGHALLKTLCDYDTSRFKRMACRFTAPVFPGETFRTEMWKDAEGVASFQVRCVDRDVIAISNGRFEYAA
jgi:acyl dehydratase